MIKLIDFNEEYDFFFVEEEEIKFMHPVSDYYLKLDDLSVNLFISLKWIKWGYKFLCLISSNLDDLGEEFSFKKIISKSIQKVESIKEKKKIILLDDVDVTQEKEFEERIKNFYLNKDFSNTINENTKIHLKLKVNLREYLILSNILYPRLAKFKSCPI